MTTKGQVTRRQIIRAAAVAAAIPSLSSIARGEPTSSSATATSPATTQADKPNAAIIGCGNIGNFHALFAQPFVDVVAVCDVDKNRAAGFNQKWCAGKGAVSGDYRELITRKDIDLVWVCTPDHWHTKIAIDAMRAGKDVYCEKPATLTFAESKLLCRVTRETSRIVQVGTQQRQDQKFLTAIALAHSGRLGKISRVVVAIGDTPKGADFQKIPAPPELDWDMWLGQAPMVDFLKQRLTDFRWWYEYSGGLMTDWGAHHVDIAQLAVAPDLPGPTMIEPISVTLPVPFKDGYPTVDNAFNTPGQYNVKCTFANGVEMFICDHSPDIKEDNGVLIEGDKGAVFVNRDKIYGTAIDALKENPLRDDFLFFPPLDLKIEQPHQRHIAEFVRCAESRKLPRADVWSHHKILTTCHLANIAMRLNRKLHWDATAEQIVGDAQANAFLAREQRKGYEIA